MQSDSSESKDDKSEFDNELFRRSVKVKMAFFATD